MLVLDVPPDVPPQYAPTLVAQASLVQAPLDLERTVGVCHFIDARPEAVTLAVNTFTPLRSASYYLRTVERKGVGREGSTTLLKGPAHGELENDAEGNYLFVAKPGYYGPDKASFLVEIGSYKVTVVYQFKIVPGVSGGAYWDNPEYCPKGRVWKISLDPDDPSAHVNTFLYTPKIQLIRSR